jgi:hypothetical protein
VFDQGMHELSIKLLSACTRTVNEFRWIPVFGLRPDQGFYPYKIRGFHNDQDS